MSVHFYDVWRSFEFRTRFSNVFFLKGIIKLVLAKSDFLNYFDLVSFNVFWNVSDVTKLSILTATGI